LKILLLDLETAPNLATVWGLFKQNIALNQLIDSSYTLCWAAKWYGEDTIYFDSIHRSTPKQMTRRIHKLLDEADAVIHYNGKKFDIPTLNRDFLLQGLTPPSPYKQIDLLTTVRSQFRAPSNKLDYWVQKLGLGHKVKHEGHELWLKCMNGDDEAWSRMEEYNINDVDILEKLYDKVRPWIKNHPNHAIFSGEAVCPNCGGNHLKKRGLYPTTTMLYQRLRCSDCGTWSRSVIAEPSERADKRVAI
jgi:DNA polymerase elongation subunit (family B)